MPEALGNAIDLEAHRVRIVRGAARPIGEFRRCGCSVSTQATRIGGHIRVERLRPA